jgi:hypothetical protein
VLQVNFTAGRVRRSQCKGKKCLVNWGSSLVWEDAHNLINVVGKKLFNSNKEVRNDK